MTSYSADISTPLARSAFVSLARPRKNDKGQEKYEINLLWPKGTDLSVVEAAVLEAAKGEWGDKAVQMFKDGLIKNPFLDGDGPQAVNKKTGERYAGFAGQRFIRCSANGDHKPRVYDQKVVLSVDPNLIYSGCYVHAVINAFTWVNEQNGKGVSFGVKMVQFAKDGEKLGGGGDADPNDHFKPQVDASVPAGTTDGKGAAGLFG